MTNNREIVAFHGTSELGINKFNRVINWFTTDIKYAETFGKKVYSCLLTPVNIFDAGKTDGRIFTLMPVQPFKFSEDFKRIVHGFDETEVRDVIKSLAVEYGYDYDGYKMPIFTFIRSGYFAQKLEALGYDAISAIEFGHQTYGILNADCITIVDKPLIEDLKDDAKEYFGTTWNWKFGNYINTDGTILDGSGRKLGNSNPTGRAIDHREVADIFTGTISGEDAMLAYMNEGNIRLKPELPGIEIIKAPTKAQLNTINKIIYYNYHKEFIIDYSDPNGNILDSIYYESADKNILIDIETKFGLKEDTRTALLNKSKSVDNYKDQTNGKNRFERKKFSKVSQTVKEYNQLDMDDFFKRDILTIKVPVTGETDNYVVSLRIDGICGEIAKNIKANNNKFEFKTVIQALTKMFNTANIKVNCTCKDFLYNYQHNLIINNNNVDGTDKDPGPGKTGKTAQMKGQGCKHILLVLSNQDFLMKVASCIKNYITYAEEHMKAAFDKLIFPKLYGIQQDEAIEKDLVSDEINLETEKHIIEKINEWAANRGKYQKGSNKNPVTGTGGRAKKSTEADSQYDEETKQIGEPK